MPNAAEGPRLLRVRGSRKKRAALPRHLYFIVYPAVVCNVKIWLGVGAGAGDGNVNLELVTL